MGKRKSKEKTKILLKRRRKDKKVKEENKKVTKKSINMRKSLEKQNKKKSLELKRIIVEENMIASSIISIYFSNISLNTFSYFSLFFLIIIVFFFYFYFFFDLLIIFRLLFSFINSFSSTFSLFWSSLPILLVSPLLYWLLSNQISMQIAASLLPYKYILWAIKSKYQPQSNLSHLFFILRKENLTCPIFDYIIVSDYGML